MGTLKRLKAVFQKGFPAVAIKKIAILGTVETIDLGVRYGTFNSCFEVIIVR
jgi:hypothetical protein